MSFLLSLALGCAVFSLLFSVLLFARHSRREKTEYEKWMDEVRPSDITNPQRQLSKS